ncbi:MAG: hypothetical protein J1F35_08205 [Erysipelotrichales bacterium]|nr:hypothetical protein [Erysipelotrichales bacterium]
MEKITKDDLLSLIDRGFYELVNSDLRLVKIHICAIIESGDSCEFEYICKNSYYVETINKEYSDVVYNLTDYIWENYGDKLVVLPEFRFRKNIDFGRQDIYFN